MTKNLFIFSHYFLFIVTMIINTDAIRSLHNATVDHFLFKSRVNSAFFRRTQRVIPSFIFRHRCIKWSIALVMFIIPRLDLFSHFSKHCIMFLPGFLKIIHNSPGVRITGSRISLTSAGQTEKSKQHNQKHNSHALCLTLKPSGVFNYGQR